MMQNVSFKDMYNLSLHQNKYNGLLSHSSRASKKDRKGCKKGKIETILKNKMVNACNRLAAPTTPSAASPASTLKKVLSYNTVAKANQAKHEPADDPYTFTDQEPPYHNPAGSNTPGPPTAGPRKEPQIQSLKNMPAGPPIARSAIKKEAPPGSGQSERCQNIPPPAPPSTPPPPPLFKMPLVSELKPPPKRRKSNSSPVGASAKAKAQHTKADKSDTGGGSGKLGKSKEKAEAASSVLSMRVTLPARLQRKQRRQWKKVGGSGVKHEALQRIERAVNEHDDVHTDLHSLGVDLSDSEDELTNKSNSGDSGLYQHHWLSNTIDYMQREEKILQLKNELHRRLGQVIETINIEKKSDCLETPLQRSLVQAAREVPSHTALVLDPNLYKTHSKGKRCDKLLLRKRRCHVTGCAQYALPCNRFCSLHVLLCPSQTLFCPCAAVTPTQATCHRPALPIYTHAPLCFTHKTVLGMNSPREVPRPHPPTSTIGSSVPSSSTSSITTGSPTFRVPPPPPSRKPRNKKTPPVPKPPRVSRSKKKQANPQSPFPMSRGVKTHLAHHLVHKAPTGVVNHTLAPPVHKAPTGLVNHSLTNSVQKAPSRVVNHSPASSVNKAPAGVVNHSLASSVHKAPSGIVNHILATPSSARSRASDPHPQVLKNVAPPQTLPPMYTLHPPSSVPVNSSTSSQHNVIHSVSSTSGNTETVHHYADLGNDEQVSEAVLAIASMDPEELANRASRLLEEHESLSVGEFSDLFSVEEVSEEVLSIAAQDPVELSNQASRLLEHEDITTVLNHLPADAFDLFSEDKSSEEDDLHRALVLTGDVKDLTGASAVDRLFTYLDDGEGSPLHPTLLFSSTGVTYPPNGYHHSTSTSSPASEMRHS